MLDDADEVDIRDVTMTSDAVPSPSLSSLSTSSPDPDVNAFSCGGIEPRSSVSLERIQLHDLRPVRRMITAAGIDADFRPPRASSPVLQPAFLEHREKLEEENNVQVRTAVTLGFALQA